MPAPDPHIISTPAALATLSGPLTEASIKEETDHVHPLYAEIIAASPFLTLATPGPTALIKDHRS